LSGNYVEGAKTSYVLKGVHVTGGQPNRSVGAETGVEAEDAEINSDFDIS
jgi:hypothetical protein